MLKSIKPSSLTSSIESDAAGKFKSINGRASYEEGHIPGAGFADLLGDLSDADAELQYTLPSPEAFAAAMGALGVGDDTRVVLYDRMGLPWAARVWWMLRWIGFDNAALLDGGLDALLLPLAEAVAGDVVEDDPVEASVRCQIKPVPPCLGLLDRETGLGEPLGNKAPGFGIVFDNQQFAAHNASFPAEPSDPRRGFEWLV